MQSMWTSYWKILKTDPEVFEAVKQARDSVWFALKLFVLVGLITGVGKLSDLGTTLRRPTLVERVDQVAVSMEELAIDLPPILVEPLRAVADTVREVANFLAQFQPPLGARPSRVIVIVGDWLSTPFELLAVWWGIMLALWILARLLGGKGALRQHVSLLSLAVAPQTLTLVSYIAASPVFVDASLGAVGSVLRVIAFFWSLLIAFRALIVAHDYHPLQATETLVAYFTIFIVLGPLIFILFVGYLLSLLF